ncbi:MULTISPECIES: hypothetical protein [Acinetobacter]|jgi:uncharacterized protein YceK|uniref:PEGA domain-containing protein n=2 Tax=Acinetobacter beijerinckii TaxID=262668 RepID=N9FB06_9GAMM|nr:MULTISPECIES: hypothetical protein [Acinetobacter]ENW03278.1 hypothetical protein F933_03312 [Acinetobacter beijerinckii CIP 110307]ENW04480.1 hypothetical protein F934_02529 [Acinetobacter beijerinckii ANC 3835]MBC9227718.1 hypothetical protein [Acinetobacter baumannii]UTO20322.1 hypothetical protein NGC85_04320 [Acinetobacter sp. Z1]
MKKLSAVFGVAVLSLSGCASIMSGSSQTMTFESTPELSDITILNKAGKKVHVGKAPVTVSLKRSSGFFSPEKYTVIFEKEGFETKTVNVSAHVNGWYVGNILFGGVLGLLIIDPATGAMYSLSTKETNVALKELNKENLQANTQSLTIVSTEELPKDILDKAKPIKLQSQ